jgi:hypothetical protein
MRLQIGKDGMTAGVNRMPFRVIFADIESGYNDGYPNWGNADPNGWYNDAATNDNDDQADFAVWAGFRDKVNKLNEGQVPGVYSSPTVGQGWNAFVVASINTYNTISAYDLWTAETDSGYTLNCPAGPTGWTQSIVAGGSSSASFFAGQSTGSSNAVMWQWSNGQYNTAEEGGGDWDQVDMNRLQSGF